MKKITLFAAAFAMTFGVAAASDGLAWTKIRRYSAFYCYGTASAAHAAGRGVMDPSSGGSIFCPHASSEDFELSEVEFVDLSINNHTTSASNVTGSHGWAKACVSWSYADSNAVSQYNHDCGHTKEVDGDVLGGQTVRLQADAYLLDQPGELQPWHDRPFGFAYILVNSGSLTVTHPAPVGTFTSYPTTVTGYRVYN